MSLKSQSHFISPLTGKEVSKATYYRHVKKAVEYEPNNGSKRNIWPVKKSQSQSHQQRSHIILESPLEVEEYEAKNVEEARFAGLHGVKRNAANGVKEMGSVDIFSRSQFYKQDEVDENIKNILQDTYEDGKESHETVSSEIQLGGTVAGSFFLCETEMELVSHVFNSFEKQYQKRSPDWVVMLRNLRGRLGI